MKTLTTLFFLIACSSISFAQNIACSSLSFDAQKEIIVQGNIPFSGICENFQKTGELKETRTFKNGVLHGLNTVHHKNGTILKEGNYANGVVDGTWKHYDSKGNILSEKSYKNGEVVK